MPALLFADVTPDQLLFGESVNLTVLLAVIAAVSFLVGLWLGDGMGRECRDLTSHFGEPDDDL